MELTKEQIEEIKVMHCAGKKHSFIMSKFNISWKELKDIIFEKPLIDIDRVMNEIFKDENLVLIRDLLEQENERRKHGTVL
jgi:predicted ABC-class ATPase